MFVTRTVRAVLVTRSTGLSREEEIHSPLESCPVPAEDLPRNPGGAPVAAARARERPRCQPPRRAAAPAPRPSATRSRACAPPRCRAAASDSSENTQSRQAPAGIWALHWIQNYSAART